MKALAEWFAMGGYSAYIWPAYGLFFIVLGVNVLGIPLQKRRTKKQLQQWFRHSL